MDLVGARKVFIGSGDHAAMRVFQPVKARFKPFHSDTAQIDDIATQRFLVRGNKRAHNIMVLEKGLGV